MKQFGYSLIETVISLLVISIAITASLKAFQPSQKLASLRIGSFLRSSLNESLIRGEKVIVRKQGKRIIAKGETFSRASSIPVMFRFQGDKIAFYVSGAATPKTIHILGANACRVTLSLRGRILERCNT